MREAYILQLYGLHMFTKMIPPIDPKSGLIETGPSAALELIIKMLEEDPFPTTGIYSGTSNHVLFLFHALHNIIGDHSGRVEFFNTREVDAKYGGYGIGWERAVEQQNEKRLKILLKYLYDLPVNVSKRFAYSPRY